MSCHQLLGQRLARNVLAVAVARKLLCMHKACQVRVGIELALKQMPCQLTRRNLALLTWHAACRQGALCAQLIKRRGEQKHRTS